MDSEKTFMTYRKMTKMPLNRPQGRKLTFLGRRQLATDLFFSVAKWENVVTSCEILVASAKFLVALATRKVQFPTLGCETLKSPQSF